MPAETKDTEVTIKWNEPQNNGAPITQYTVYHKTVSGDGTLRQWNKIKVVDNVSVRKVTVKLEKGKEYEFVVTARNSFGEILPEEGQIKKIMVLGDRCMYQFFFIGRGAGVEIIIPLFPPMVTNIFPSERTVIVMYT